MARGGSLTGWEAVLGTGEAVWPMGRQFWVPGRQFCVSGRDLSRETPFVKLAPGGP